MIGKAFHVIGPDCVLGRRDGRLVVHRDGVLRASAPLTMVGEVVTTGRVTVTPHAMHSMLAHDIPLILLSRTGRPLGRLEPPTAGHIAARLRQLDRHRDPAARLDLARAVIPAKIANQATLLRRRAKRSGDPATVWAAVTRLAEFEQAASAATDLAQLIGIEGAAAGAYFRAIRVMTPAEYGFAARDRSRRDVTNALINYCSALLRETVHGAILAAGLDPYLSFLHTPSRGRPTLAFDLMEEWRPALLESTVLAMLGLRTVTDADFDGTHLTPGATSALISRYQARLAMPAREWPAPADQPTYHQLVRRQALRLRGWLLDEQAQYRPFRWR
ncbi:CRISPR-associated endonuclease Cas1 [Solwaraspora sp. WMMD937]|uniref:CRISPR-associated endonuclease Cas1 n=1 Tax=Solwaraspora sp. WMMD937 TaxID=3016090 RepID=UPI00249AC7C4|nr:CRISPR-associated endonuclease Cas1 [Solwaraspora sp. WMMD937]WFE21065.1 CRISPR-associated endonuclease Cas1 [Solwaraspora sp. WMMD937]